MICFRRVNAPFREAQFALRAINPDADYRLTDLDAGTETRVKAISWRNWLFV